MTIELIEEVGGFLFAGYCGCGGGCCGCCGCCAGGGTRLRAY